jgi:hypothetical protein
MRQLKELYTILINSCYDSSRFGINYGICFQIDVLYDFYVITHEERYLLRKHIRDQQPTLPRTILGIEFGGVNKEFAKSPLFQHKDCYWFPLDKEGRLMRIKLLLHIYNKL